jgi:predicted RNA-binding Zn-ribbon protein involved in translation (DUF1610 family)
MSNAIDQDIFCANCGYNLRTLSQASRCPECGMPVVRSVERHRATEGWNLRRLAMGFLLVAAYPILPAIRRMVPDPLDQPLRHALLSLAEPLAAGLLLVAILLIVRSGPASTRRGWRRRFGVDTALALLMFQGAVYAFLQITVLIRHHFGLHYPPHAALYEVVPDIANLLTPFLHICLLVAAVVLLHKVPRVLERPWLGRLATTCLVALAAASACHAIYFVVALVQWSHYSFYVNALVRRFNSWEDPMTYGQWIVHWGFWCFMAHWAMRAACPRGEGIPQPSA